MGVDCDAFRPDARRPEARERLLARVDGGENTVLLLYCGRLAPEKNISLLAELIEMLAPDASRDFRLLIAGDGILRESFLADAAARVPGRVHWLGFVAGRNELAALYAGCDIFVHPNPAEPFGIAPMEAMAAGLPLVAPDAGGVLAYANASNAWLEPARADRFAAAVRHIIEKPEERGQRVGRARDTAEQYSWPAVASRYLKLYSQLDELTRGQQRVAPEFPELNPVP